MKKREYTEYEEKLYRKQGETVRKRVRETTT